MRISEFSVKNYQFTLVVFLGVLSLGIFSLLNMPRGEDPNFEAPIFAVVAIYPGASPADVEELVVDPIEKRLSELEDIDKIITNVSDGLALFRVEFKYESDADDKYQEVLREINALRSELPEDLYKLEINPFSPSDVNIFQFALVSENAPYSRLEEQAEQLGEQLEKIRSLKNVEAQGFPERELRIELNLDKMAQARIPVSRVLGALQSENVNIPGGSIDAGTKKFNVKTTGSYESVEEVKNTIVASTGLQVIYLRDIADIRMDYVDQKYITRINGHRAVFVTASLKPDENITQAREVVLPVVESFKKGLPSNMDFITVFDQGESVSRRLNRFAKDFTIAILLVLITLLPLGQRASVVVMISIPLSLAIGLTLLNLLGYTINQLSIVGMIVALGILVDDSIVVVENIERYLREGQSRRDAAINATKQIGLAVVGCTATLIFAFLPLAFLPEASGDFIRSLPMAVITTVLASMVVSLTIVPFLSSRLLKEHQGEGNIFLRALKRLISGTYSRLLDRALTRPVITLVISFLIFGACLTLIPSVGFSLFPRSDKPMFVINIETPAGSNIEETNRIVREVEAALAEKKEIRSYASNVGKGNPRIYYNVFQQNETENYGQIFVQLYSEETGEKVAFIDELRAEFRQYPNAVISVKDFEQGPPVEAPLVYRIFSEDLDTLRKLSFEIEQMVAETEGTIYVDNPLRSQPTDLKVAVNKDKAGLSGVLSSEIDRTIRLGIAGLEIGKFREGNGDEFPINVSLSHEEAGAGTEVFNRLYVSNVNGTPLPLRQVADITFESSPNQIRHYDRERYTTISAYSKSGYLTSEVNAQIEQKLARFDFPQGSRYVIAGEVESRERSFGGLGTIILITAFGFIGILVLEFKTFKSTLIVLSVIPLGVIGAILMLWVTGETFSFTAVIGLIALVGIEVKNSILLVDFTNQLREQGMPLEEAIREAGEVRFVPIVLTSLTAIGGLIPLVIEYSPLYSPLALVLIGGLISSTLLSRLVTPVMYKLLPPAIEA
ncbi:MAG: efflux RND transporter permease subunit [Bacteroidetes bacterium]|nr:MAG: efflux RND transporter permease subunit [Bacteroidota bacterium]